MTSLSARIAPLVARVWLFSLLLCLLPLCVAACARAQNLSTAATSDDARSAASLLENGADPNRPDALGNTALHVAAINGSNHVIQLLLAKGANIEAKNNLGHTPLWEAATSGQEETVRLLLQQGANPNQVSYSGAGLIDTIENLKQVGHGLPNFDAIERLLRSGRK